MPEKLQDFFGFRSFEQGQVTATITRRMSSRSSLEARRRVQQHEIVYDALGGHMGGAPHALALQTSIPKDA